MSLATHARMLKVSSDVPWDSLPLVELPRMPNPDWLEFLTGPLSLEDWALIRRVEAQDISVDDAMAWREGRPDDAYGDQFPDQDAA